jgi:hypothetical protein
MYDYVKMDQVWRQKEEEKLPQYVAEQGEISLKNFPCTWQKGSHNRLLHEKVNSKRGRSKKNPKKRKKVFFFPKLYSSNFSILLIFKMGHNNVEFSSQLYAWENMLNVTKIVWEGSTIQKRFILKQRWMEQLVFGNWIQTIGHFR